MTIQDLWASLPSDLKGLLVGAAGELTASLLERALSALGTTLRGTPEELALRAAYTQAGAAFLACLELPEDPQDLRDWLAHIQGLLKPLFADDQVQAALTNAVLHAGRPEAVDPAPLQAAWAERYGHGGEATLPWREGLGLPDAVRAFARAFEHEAEARPELHTFLLAARLKRAVDRLETGVWVEGMDALLEAVQDLEDRLQAFFTEWARLGYSPRSVSVRGDVTGSVIITGDNNQVFVPDGGLLARLLQALPGPQQRQAETVRQVTLYRRALIRYCEELPYVSLPGARRKRPPLSTLYVRRRVQRKPGEESAALTPPPGPLPSPAQQERGGVKATPPERMPTIEAVRRHRHLVLLGEPGAGKTTWLYHTVQCLAEGKGEEVGVTEPLLPVLVRLGPLSRREGSFPDRLRAVLENELGLSLPEDFFETWPGVAGARGWLLACDGLDEVGDRETRQNIVRWLEGLAEGPHRVLVTSRPAGYEAVALKGDGFAIFELEPFGPEEAETFARRWFGVFLPQEQAEAKANALLQVARDRGLAGLLSNPLLVTVMAVVFHEQGTFPNRRKDLYKDFIDVLLGEAEQRGLKEALERELHDGQRAADLVLMTPALLEAVALAAHREGVADEATLAAAVACLLADEMPQRTADRVAVRWLRVIGRWSGVLVARGGGYEFLHPTFREHLAARALAEDYKGAPDGLWAELEPHILDDEWAEVIPLALAHLDDATPLLERLLAANAGDEKWQRPLFRAAAALAEGAVGEEAVRRRVVDGLEHLARAKDWWQWEEEEASPHDAIRAWSQLEGEPYAAKRLLTLARDERVDLWTREDAAEALGKLGWTDAAAPILLALACDDERADPLVRGDAAAALGGLGRVDEAAQAWLAIAHDEAVDEWTRGEAASALESLGRADEAAQVWLALAHDEDVDLKVRTWAARALDKLGRTDEAVQAWLALACDEGAGSQARMRAADALLHLGRADEAAPIFLTLARESGVEAEVRQRAAKTLDRLGRADEAAQAWLALACDAGMELEERTRAAHSLLRLGRADEAAQAALALACDGGVDPEVRVGAARVLGHLGQTDEAAPILLALARDEGVDLRVRYMAASALGQLGRADDLLALARDEGVNQWVRREAAFALGALGQAAATPEVLAGLRALAEDVAATPEMVRWAAQWALLRLETL